MTPKISVIVPIFNTAQYLDKCIQSILSQTMEEIEIICVDDCSPDDSASIVEKYIEQDVRVSLIRHEQNIGQGGARNTGIMAAKASFIASVDSDDFIHPEMLQTLWDAGEQGKYDVVCCGYRRVDINAEVISKTTFNPSEIDNRKNIVNMFTLLNPAMWNKLWKKSLFIENNIFFPEKLYYQDMATIPLLVAKAQKIKIIEPCLYDYLVHEGSVTTTYSPKHIIDYFKVYEILYKFLCENNLIDRYSNNLVSYVNDGMKFHSLNVINLDIPEIEKKQYLRHLLMLKLSFFQVHDALLLKDVDELLLLLTKSIKIDDIAPKTKVNTIFGVKRTEPFSLNIIQKLSVYLFGVLFNPFINRNQMIKLQTDPKSFFKDSKNKFTRAIGFFLQLT